MAMRVWNWIKQLLPNWIKQPRGICGFIAGIIALGTFGFALWWFFQEKCYQNQWQRVGQVLAAVWAVGPPIYFFFEWWLFSGLSEVPTVENQEYKNKFEQFKYSQDIASKIWIAFAATLAVIFGMKPF